MGEGWLQSYVADFTRRFASLLSYNFRDFSPSLALSILLADSSSRISNSNDNINRNEELVLENSNNNEETGSI